MKNITYERLKDFERDPSNNFLTRSEMMEAVKELIAIRELKGEQVPDAIKWRWKEDEHSSAGAWIYINIKEKFEDVKNIDGAEWQYVFTAPQKPVISKEKLCDWLEDNFDIDDSKRDAFADCFAHNCNCIVKTDDE